MHRNYVLPHENRSCLLTAEMSSPFHEVNMQYNNKQTTTSEPRAPRICSLIWGYAWLCVREFRLWNCKKDGLSRFVSRTTAMHWHCEKGPQCRNIGTGECHVYVTIMSIMIMIIMIIMKDTAVVNLSIKNNSILFCMILQCCFQICHDCDNFFLCVSIAKSKFKLFIASPTKKGNH